MMIGPGAIMIFFSGVFAVVGILVSLVNVLLGIIRHPLARAVTIGVLTSISCFLFFVFPTVEWLASISLLLAFYMCLSLIAVFILDALTIRRP